MFGSLYLSTTQQRASMLMNLKLSALTLSTYCWVHLTTKLLSGSAISISPTVHALLAHSWELIQANNDHDLGVFTESGLEANNKFLRFYRQYLSRKRNQAVNMSDTFTRLWLRCDPQIRNNFNHSTKQKEISLELQSNDFSFRKDRSAYLSSSDITARRFCYVSCNW